MKKVKKPKRVINNQVVAYYIEKKWDTQLDALDIQRKRVMHWAEKAGCEIIFEVVDQNNGEHLKLLPKSRVALLLQIILDCQVH